LLRRLRVCGRHGDRSRGRALVGDLRQPALGDHDPHAGADVPRGRAQRRAREPGPEDVRNGARAARADGGRGLAMQDRPSPLELLGAVGEFREDDLVHTREGRRRFQALVAANVLGLVERELHGEEEQLGRQWNRLAELFALDRTTRPVALSALRAAINDLETRLVERIRAGEADSGDFATRVRPHVRTTTEEKLAAATPKYLDAFSREPPTGRV